MKKKIFLFRKQIMAVLLILVLLFPACYQFDFVNQPFTADSNSSFIVEISASTTDGDGAEHIPYFGIMLPEGWTVNDSIEFINDTVTGIFVYSDSLVQVMDTIDVPPAGYYWWVSMGANPVIYNYGDTYVFNPVINTDSHAGMFFLDYMLGSNYGGSDGGINWARSNDHIISVGLADSITVINTNDSGPGSLRAAIDDVDFFGTVYFDLEIGDTILLQDQLNIYKDISIIGPEDMPVVISGSFDNRVLFINAERNPLLSNLHIVNGCSDFGGGMYCEGYSNTSLRNITISNNFAEKGGGIYYDYNANMTFDSIHRCNIYQNIGAWGNDLYASGNTYFDMIVDTFTVLHPSEFHIYPLDNFSSDILNKKLDQVDADLYVSPDGYNTNSGLTADEPLKTINFAFSIIRADSLNRNTVHLLEGTYSRSTNEEVMPIIIPDYININGESENDVTLDAEGQSNVITIDQNLASNISGLTITGVGTDTTYGRGLSSLNSNLTLQNVTITNNQGCGIYCQGDVLDSLRLENVTITNNSYISDYGRGGGIYCSQSNPVLVNVKISNNYATEAGGGMYCNASNPVLKNVTISHNFAEYGGGICCLYSVPVFDSINRCNIYLNSANWGSDIHHDSYMDVIVDTFSVLHPTAFHADPVGDCSFEILNAKLQQADSDLFVSPDGDDANSGLTQDEPLKTIRNAMSRILADNLYQNTVQLLAGVYGPSGNQEIMPIVVPDYYILSGTSANEIIIDAEWLSNGLVIDAQNETHISDLTITRSGRGISCCGQLSLNNVVITNNSTGIYFGAITSSAHAVLQNVLVANNNYTGIYCEDSDVALNNVTISENDLGVFCLLNSEVYMKNTIISNNTEGAVSFDGYNTGNYFSAAWSDIDGWISTHNGSYNLSYCISEDPIFVGSGAYPYALSDESPCVNTGTPDTTGLNLPEFDLAGNPRFYGGRVDMGAYENQNVTVFISQHESPGIELSCLPNPFSGELTISWNLPEPAYTTIEMYCARGNKIKELITDVLPAGNHAIHWKANHLTPGIYYVRMKIDNEILSREIIKL
nr:hypothetical protein [Bacteroidota bacterium]